MRSCSLPTACAGEKGLEVARLLQGALLAAEGMYLDDTEDEDRAEFPG